MTDKATGYGVKGLTIEPNFSSEEYITALNLAIKQNNLESVTKKLSTLKSPLCDMHLTAQEEITLAEEKENKLVGICDYKKTVIPHPLILAIEMRQINIIQYLLKHQNEQILKQTLSKSLKLAVKNHAIEIVEILMMMMKKQIIAHHLNREAFLEYEQTLPEIKFLLDPKQTIADVSNGRLGFFDFFQINRYVNKNSNAAEFWKKDFYTCLDTLIKNAIRIDTQVPVALILNNKDIPVTLQMVMQAFQLAKKELQNTRISLNKQNNILAIIELLDKKMEECETKKEKNEKSIFNLAIEYNYDEVFFHYLEKKSNKVLGDHAEKLFNDFTLGNNIAMQQKLLESALLSKEYVVKVLNHVVNETSKPSQIFEIIANISHHKEALNDFISVQLGLGRYDIIHLLLSMSNASISREDIIKKMNAAQKKKTLYITSNQIVIKDLITGLDLREKFDLLREAFSLNNNQNFLYIYNSLYIQEKVELWLHSVQQPQNGLLDHLLLNSSNHEIIQIIEFLEEPQFALTNLLLAKLSAKEITNLLENNPSLKEAVVAFINHQLTLKAYDKIRDLFNVHSDVISSDEIAYTMTLAQKISMLFKPINEKIFKVVLDHLKFEEKISFFEKNYSTAEQKAVVLKAYFSHPIEVRGHILTQLVVNEKYDLFTFLFQTNIEEIIDAITHSEKPKPELTEVFLQALSFKQIGQLVSGNPSFVEEVKIFLRKKALTDANFVKAVFSNSVKNLTLMDVIENFSDEEKIPMLFQNIDRNSVSLILTNLKHDNKLKIFTEFANKTNQHAILKIYICLPCNEKVMVLLELIKQQKNTLVDFLISATEENIKLIVFLKKSNLTLSKLLLEKLTAKDINEVLEQAPNVKNIIIEFIQSKINLKAYEFLATLLQVSIISPNEIVKKMSPQDRIAILFKCQGFNKKIVSCLLEDIKSTDQQVGFLAQYHTPENQQTILNIYRSIFASNKESIVLKLVSDQKYTLIVLLATQNIEETLNVILTSKAAPLIIANAVLQVFSTADAEQVLKNNTKVQAILSKFIQQQIKNHAYDMLTLILNVEFLRDFTQKNIIPKIKSESQKFALLFSAAEKDCQPLIEILLKNFTKIQKLNFKQRFMNREKEIPALVNLYQYLSIKDKREALLYLFKHNKINLVEQLPIFQDVQNNIQMILHLKKKAPRVTIRLLGMLSASQIYGLINKESELDNFIQECLPYNDKKFEIFCLALKEKNNIVIDRMLKDVFLAEHLLHTAVINDDKEIVEFLLSKKYFISDEHKNTLINKATDPEIKEMLQNSLQYTHFLAALESRDKLTVKALLDSSLMRASLLTTAAALGNKKIVEYILGVAGNFISEATKRNAISRTKFIEIKQLLDDSLEYPKLLSVLKSKDPERIKKLNKSLGQWTELLNIAAQSNNSEVVGFILRSVGKNILDSDKKRILFHIFNVEIKKMLMDSLQYNQLLAAVMSNNPANAELLLKDKKMHAEFLDTAAILNHQGVIQFILTYPNQKVSDENKARIIARTPHKEVKKQLNESRKLPLKEYDIDLESMVYPLANNKTTHEHPMLFKYLVKEPKANLLNQNTMNDAQKQLLKNMEEKRHTLNTKGSAGYMPGRQAFVAANNDAVQQPIIPGVQFSSVLPSTSHAPRDGFPHRITPPHQVQVYNNPPPVLIQRVYPGQVIPPIQPQGQNSQTEPPQPPQSQLPRR